MSVETIHALTVQAALIRYILLIKNHKLYWKTFLWFLYYMVNQKPLRTVDGLKLSWMSHIYLLYIQTNAMH